MHWKFTSLENEIWRKGYRITIQTEIRFVSEVKQFFSDQLPTSHLLTETGGRFTFGVNQSEINKLIEFFEFLETDPRAKAIIRDWGVSHTTLEEVFLKITKQYSHGGEPVPQN